MNTATPRHIASVIVLTGIASTVYAACCRFNMSWPSNPSAPCSGATAKTCETSSVDCTQPSSGGPNQECKVKFLPRKANCYDITLLQFGEWALVGCSTAMPHPWVFVGRNADGSCCWVKNAAFNTTPQTYTVDDCKNVCGGSGGV